MSINSSPASLRCTAFVPEPCSMPATFIRAVTPLCEQVRINGYALFLMNQKAVNWVNNTRG
jgi:hypothetical protein